MNNKTGTQVISQNTSPKTKHESHEFDCEWFASYLVTGFATWLCFGLQIVFQCWPGTLFYTFLQRACDLACDLLFLSLWLVFGFSYDLYLVVLLLIWIITHKANQAQANFHVHHQGFPLLWQQTNSSSSFILFKSSFSLLVSSTRTFSEAVICQFLSECEYPEIVGVCRPFPGPDGAGTMALIDCECEESHRQWTKLWTEWKVLVQVLICNRMPRLSNSGLQVKRWRMSVCRLPDKIRSTRSSDYKCKCTRSSIIYATRNARTTMTESKCKRNEYD